MKVRLEVVKAGHLLHEGSYEINDKASFAAACAQAWAAIHERCMAEATSVGQLMDTINENVLEALIGAEIKLKSL